jgi:hypothetical protein
MVEAMRQSRLPEPAQVQTRPPDQGSGNGATAIGHPDARIDVSAQLISLEPGLFCVSVANARVMRTEGGMVLPCVRFDALPRRGGEEVFVASLTGSSLLPPGAPPAYLRVAGGRAAVLLTTYKLAGASPPPEIHITLVEPMRQPAAPAPEPSADAIASAALTLLVHVQGHGDLPFAGGTWAGAPDGGGAIEGFAIAAGPDLPAGSLEYQAKLGRDWLSPWMAEGEFCGSRQMALTLLGASIRLRGPAAADFWCRVWGRFGGVELGPFEDGALCEAGDAALTGLRVAVVPRGAAARPRPRRRGA